MESKVIESTLNLVHLNARRYAKAGLHIFPLHGVVDGACTCGRVPCGDIGKHPWTDNGVNAATTDLQVIDEWWADKPHLNIGLNVGASGLYVIDDDTGRKGSDALARLAEQGIVLETPCVSTTGGGGRHLYYKATNTDFDSPKVNALKGLGLHGLDVRAGNSYVVLPPSLHESGGLYRWRKGLDRKTFHELLPNVPEAWIGLVRSCNASAKVNLADEVRHIINGCRHDTLLRLIGKLGRSVDVQDLGILDHALNQTYSSPPLEAEELDKMVEHVATNESWRFGQGVDDRVEIPDGMPPHTALRLLEEAIANFANSNRVPRLLIQHGGFVSAVEADNGHSEIVRLDDSRLKRLALRVAKFVRKEKEVAPPGHLIELLRSAPTVGAVRSQIPVLRETVTRPYVASCGSFVAESQYFRKERMLALIPEMLSARADEAVREASEDRATQAAAILKEAFSDTPFADEGGWPRCLAMAVTPTISRWLGAGEKWPWLLVDAPLQATGKSTLARGVGALAGGSALIRFKHSDDEMEKAVYDILQKGTPTLILDNLTQRVDSALFSILVTEREISLRKLGTNLTPTFPNHLLIIGTANNPIISTDLASRALHVRLDSRMANPNARQFERPTPEVLVASSPDVYSGAIYDVIAWWVKRGMPLSSEQTVTRFRRWERAVREILGGVGFALDVKNQITADPVDEAFRSFVTAWWEGEGEELVGMEILRTLAFEKKHLVAALGQNELGRVLSHQDAANSKLGKLLQSKRDVLFQISGEIEDLQVTIERLEGRTILYKLKKVG